MFDLFLLWFGALIRLLRSRRELALENLALRQQLGVLKRRHPRPNLGTFDRLFWVVARRVWFGWKQSLIIVTPETVVGWHRAGFRLYWRLISRARRKVGKKPTAKEVRDLIFRMVAENPTWGAPRIHGELLMLSFDISERTVSRWMKRAPREPELAKRWPFCATTEKPLQPWTSSRSRLLRSVCALLLFHHRPRSEANLALQRHQAPDEPVDRPAVTGSVSVRGGF
jgi:hypothetical protein